VWKLGLLDGEQEHRPLAQVERHRPVLQLAVDLERLGEQLVDPRRGLREEEAAVSTRRAGADSARIDEEDIGACFGEEACGRAAGEAGADDDCVVLQVVSD
jgi:hypothetical protein